MRERSGGLAERLLDYRARLHRAAAQRECYRDALIDILDTPERAVEIAERALGERHTITVRRARARQAKLNAAKERS